MHACMHAMSLRYLSLFTQDINFDNINFNTHRMFCTAHYIITLDITSLHCIQHKNTSPHIGYKYPNVKWNFPVHELIHFVIYIYIHPINFLYPEWQHRQGGCLACGSCTFEHITIIHSTSPHIGYKYPNLKWNFPVHELIHFVIYIYSPY